MQFVKLLERGDDAATRTPRARQGPARFHALHAGKPLVHDIAQRKRTSRAHEVEHGGDAPASHEQIRRISFGVASYLDDLQSAQRQRGGHVRHLGRLADAPLAVHRHLQHRSHPSSRSLLAAGATPCAPTSPFTDRRRPNFDAARTRFRQAAATMRSKLVFCVPIDA